MVIRIILKIFVFNILLTAILLAQNPSYSWRYYRPSNTGIQGDNNEAVWLDANGDPWISGYNEFFEEGGFARFDQLGNRWMNYSNVDYPVIGDPNLPGNSRISEIEEGPDGVLWMGTWRGVLKFDPAVGPASLVRHSNNNTPHPGGRTTDVAVAPDGSIWFAVFNVSWGLGGLVRHLPQNNQWTWWGYNSSANNWPGATSCERVSVQPKPGGGYRLWLFGDVFTGVISYDSDKNKFTLYPYRTGPGDLDALPGKDCSDEVGNVWMVVFQGFTQPSTMVYVTPDSQWVAVPLPYPTAADEVTAFKAFGNGEALMSNSTGVIYYFNGSSWLSRGFWRSGYGAFDLDIDAAGNIWAVGPGGAARRDAQTGQWQRYRITNTSQYDFFNDDIALDTVNNYVYASANAGPGIGGMVRFDGQRWVGFNNEHYGLGIDWPFPTDNCDVLAHRPSTGTLLLAPSSGEIYEWDGSTFTPLNYPDIVADICEDSQGRIWALGDYYALHYFDGNQWIADSMQGFGNNILPDPSRPGTVWAAAFSEVVRTDGNYRFSRTYDQFPELNITHDILTTVAPAPDGTVWLGSTNGMFHIDPTTGNYDYFGPNNSNIPGNLVRPQVVSPDGRVWFSNWNSLPPAAPGLCWFDGSDFGVFPVEPGGLPHHQIKTMEMKLIPGGYEIWMSCASKGLAVLTVQYPTGIEDQPEPVARDFQLLQNYPNPFNPSTTISFILPTAAPISLEVFDITGRRVRTLVEGQTSAGRHEVVWDGRDNLGRPVASGMYLYRLKVGTQQILTRKMVLLK